MIVISCVFKTILYIIISSYKKDQFKLHRSFLGIKGEGGVQKQLSLQHLAVHDDKN